MVTTSYEEKPVHRQLAQKASQEVGGTYVPRRKRSIAELMQSYQANQVIVMADDRIYLHVEGAPHPLYFHPHTAYMRIQQLRRGARDWLREWSGVEEGDTVLDCTLGLAKDAILFSYWVGQKGRVVGLESQAALAYVVREGMKRYRCDSQEVLEAISRVEVIHAEHLSFLRSCPDESFDLVYFDPMFRDPMWDTDSMNLIRKVANCAPLRKESIQEALRVARKKVILKERPGSAEFARLGFQQVYTKGGKIAYGILDKGTTHRETHAAGGDCRAYGSGQN